MVTNKKRACDIHPASLFHRLALNCVLAHTHTAHKKGNFYTNKTLLIENGVFAKIHRTARSSILSPVKSQVHSLITRVKRIINLYERKKNNLFFVDRGDAARETKTGGFQIYLLHITS